MEKKQSGVFIFTPFDRQAIGANQTGQSNEQVKRGGRIVKAILRVI